MENSFGETGGMRVVPSHLRERPIRPHFSDGLLSIPVIEKRKMADPPRRFADQAISKRTVRHSRLNESFQRRGP